MYKCIQYAINRHVHATNYIRITITIFVFIADISENANFTKYNYNTQLDNFLPRLLGEMGHGEVRYKPIKYCNKLQIEQTNMCIFEVKINNYIFY